MVDPGEEVSVTVKREFGEEALNALELSEKVGGGRGWGESVGLLTGLLPFSAGEGRRGEGPAQAL